MSRENVTAEELVRRYVPPTRSAIGPRLHTAWEALAELQEMADNAPNEATKRRVYDLEKRVREDVLRTAEHNVQATQNFLAEVSEVVAEAVEYSGFLSQVSGMTGPVTDAQIDEWQVLDRDAARVEQKLRDMAGQAVWHAQRLVDPVASLSSLQAKFPTLKKSYLQ